MGALAGGESARWARVLFCALFLIFLGLVLRPRVLLSRRHAFPLIGCFSVAFYTIYGLLHPVYAPCHISKWAGWVPRIVEGRLRPPLDPGLVRTVLTVRANRILTHAQKQWPARGTIRVTVYGPLTQTFHVGDRLRFVARLHRPPPPRNPATFNFQRFLALRGIYATTSLPNASKIIVIDSEFPSWLGRIDRIRQRLDRWIRSSIPSPYNALASALLVGYRGRISPKLRDVFRKTGTAHLIAISGLHLGIVAVFLFFVIRWLIGRFPALFLYLDVQRFTAVLTVICLVFYLFLTGARLSTLRAFIMAATYLAVLFFRRTTRLEDVFLLAVFILLLFQPQAIFDSAFQLTFAAVGGILLGVSKSPEKPNSSHKKNLSQNAFRWSRTTLWITFLAMAATFPIIGTSFHRISLIGLPANFFAVPFVSFAILPVGILALILFPLFVHLATWLILLEGKLILVLTSVLKLLARFSHSQIYVFPFRWYEILFYYTTFIFAILFFRDSHRQTRKLKGAIAITSLFLLLVSWILPHWIRKPGVEIFSVKKGTYVACMNQKGHAVLVCNGLGDSAFRDDAKWTLIPYLLHERIRILDALVVTNDTPVNLRAAAGILGYKHPSYLVGPRPVLYSLKSLLPISDSRIRWKEAPAALSLGNTRIQWGGDGPNLLFLRFAGLRIAIGLTREKRAIALGKKPPALLLIPSMKKIPPLPSTVLLVHYPGMFPRYGRGNPKRGIDLHRDGAVTMEKRGDRWRLSTFLTHRSRWMEPSRP